MSVDKLKAMFPHASAATLKRNPEFAGGRCGSTPGLPNDALAIYLKAIAKPNSKYRNVKVEYEGMKFDSRHELRCWQELKIFERSGQIRDLERQVPFLLVVNGKTIGKLTVDFTWQERCARDYSWAKVVADAKSPATRKETAYRLRKRIFEAQYAPLVIREL